jgi:FMN phosphatase YigB (HAD superfamily)
VIAVGGHERQVRVVFVDWYKTLSTSLFWQRGPGCLLSATDSARVHDYVFSREELLRRWMLGALAAEDVCALAADGLGLTAPDLLADLEHSCRRMEFHDPAAVDAVQAIRRRGIRVALATDNMDAFTRWTVPALQLRSLFDGVLDSASLGTLKADLIDGQSRFFEPWLSDHGNTPSEAVLVDDSPPGSAAAIGLSVRPVAHPVKLASVLAEFAS